MTYAIILLFKLNNFFIYKTNLDQELSESIVIWGLRPPPGGQGLLRMPSPYGYKIKDFVFPSLATSLRSKREASFSRPSRRGGLLLPLPCYVRAASHAQPLWLGLL